MGIRVILANLAGKTDDLHVLAAASALAERHTAHVTAACLHEPSAAGLGGASPLGADSRAAAARGHFASWRGRHAISADWLAGETSALSHAARLADLAVTAHPGTWPDPSRHDVTALLFDGGRPVLLVPSREVGDLHRHVVIAWNGSREVARTVAFGLPFLAAAGRVSIFSAGDRESAHAGRGPKDLVRHLAWHGITADLVAIPATKRPVEETLLDWCGQERAGLLLAGAYAHGTLRELIAGGVAHHLLAHADLPLLMMH
jgi:nucleotide-binding universal stress UspA family protein